MLPSLLCELQEPNLGSICVLVVVGDVADRRRQREDHMVIRGGQQLGLALGQPSPRRRALAFRAMPIAAAIIGDDFVGAVFAARDMPAEGRRAAALDRRHYLQLAEAHVAGVGLAPRRSVVAKISATSRIGRPITAGVYAGGLLPPDFSGVR